MKFFAKVTFIFNVCFLLNVLLTILPLGKNANGNFDGILGYQPLVSTLVILGQTAIFLNLAFIILYLVRYATKKGQGIPRWIAFFNLIILPAQLYYFFF